MAVKEFVVRCRADLGQPVIDELHARGAYVGHAGETDRPAPAGPGLPLHRLLVQAETESEALAAARALLETAGARCTDLELEESHFDPG